MYDPHATLAALEAALEALKQRLEDEAHLPEASLREVALLLPPVLYALSGRGKRLRPFLVVEVARACGLAAPEKNPDVLKLALSVELFHLYTLVHDDLPCLDNAETRRGRPSVHRVYDEPSALLAGSYLSALSLELALATRVGAAAATILTRTHKEVLAGQYLDLEASGRLREHAASRPDLEPGPSPAAPLKPGPRQIFAIHAGKTGALFGASCQLGSLVSAPSRQADFAAFGRAFGVAFQLLDDCLDARAGETTLNNAVAAVSESWTRRELQRAKNNARKRLATAAAAPAQNDRDNSDNSDARDARDKTADNTKILEKLVLSLSAD